MADIITELANKSGISPDMARKGLGSLLAAFKHVLPAESFAKVESAIPGTEEMMALAQPAEGASSGGFLAAIKGMAGKIFGGNDGPAALAAHLGQLGFSVDQIKNFIPKVVEFLKARLPDDLLKQISAMLPGAGGKGA
jgi:hypothetical protein